MLVARRCTLDRAKNTAWKIEQRGNQIESSAHHDSDKPERQKQQPDKWIEYDGNDGKWPTGDQQNAEEEQFEHRCYLSCSGIRVSGGESSDNR